MKLDNIVTLEDYFLALLNLIEAGYSLSHTGDTIAEMHLVYSIKNRTKSIKFTYKNTTEYSLVKADNIELFNSMLMICKNSDFNVTINVR